MFPFVQSQKLIIIYCKLLFCVCDCQCLVTVIGKTFCTIPDHIFVTFTCLHNIPVFYKKLRKCPVEASVAITASTCCPDVIMGPDIPQVIYTICNDLFMLIILKV